METGISPDFDIFGTKSEVIVTNDLDIFLEGEVANGLGSPIGFLVKSVDN